MSEYTPTTEQAKQLYSMAAVYYNGNARCVAEERFDNFLAKVKADAWYEGASWAFDGAITVDDGHNPYRGEQA